MVSSRLAWARLVPAVLAVSALSGIGTASAHDFWIELDNYTPGVGTTVSVRLRVGMRFTGEPVPRKPERIEWFAAVGPAGEKPVEGAVGADPAGSLRVGQDGIHVIGYRSRPAFIELDAQQFEEYLAEEGLDRIVALRAGRGEKTKRGRETYSRCAKSLMAAGSARDGGHDRLLGFPLELVPEVSPYSMEGGGALPVRLIFRGEPLEGALIAAVSRQDPRVTVSGRTGADGRVTLALDRPGAWLVKCVHMFEATGNEKADWESLWATLTFEIPPRPLR